MTEGSRWYFPVYEGLFDKKHVSTMGPAVWLYGWMLSRAHVAQNGGVFVYTHTGVAQDLGRTVRTIKRWFEILQEHGYIERRARHPYHLEVAVTNWRPIEEWLNARQGLGEVHILSPPNSRSNIRSDIRSDISGIPSISIKLQSYGDPSGSTREHDCLSDAFRELLAELKLSKNRNALLREIYRLCFGGDEDSLPSYGYLGKVARQVSGAGRLAELMWQLSAKPPTGDVLAYILAMTKRSKRGANEPAGFPGVRDFRAKLEAEEGNG